VTAPAVAGRRGTPDGSGPTYDAVLLAGFGGPEKPDDVMPFLRNVTRGRGIPEERLVEVSHHYQALGGGSPINEQNRALRAALEAEFRRRGWTLPVLWGNRNWAPYLRDVVAAAHAGGQPRLLGLATSAYSSYSSCRQYREDFGLALHDTELVGSVRIDKVAPYFDRAGFVAPFVDGTADALCAAADAGISAPELDVVFTTHSIPVAMADTSGSPDLGDHGTGGAYVRQHLAVARAVLEGVGKLLRSDDETPIAEGDVRWQLAFQSRSGPPHVPWLEPDVNDVIAGLPAAGRRGVIVVPIGFVSDHVEVVWDLDHEAAETAAEHELFFARVGTPGVDPRFVAALADAVGERCGWQPQGGAAGRAIAELARPDLCAAGCCRNLRGAKPTTSAVDSARDWQGSGVDPTDLAASGIAGGALR
jgi:protoporphyrin/coproporphyrin ferrochelatase